MVILEKVILILPGRSQRIWAAS